MTQTATILIGPSGAGKSTWVENNTNEVSICSADHYFTTPSGVYVFDPSKLPQAHASCIKRFIRCAIYGDKDLVCDNTNTTIGEIAPYIAIAQAYGYKVQVVYFDTPPGVCADRNTKGVPRTIVEAMHKRCGDMFVDWPNYWPEWEREVWQEDGSSSVAKRTLKLHFHEDNK